MTLPPLQTKLADLKAQTNSKVFGLENFVDAIAAAFVSATHVFAYGQPGIAKSHTVRIWLGGIEGASEVSFFKDFSATTTASQVFGPLDLKLLRETGRQERLGDGYAQKAKYIYFNELYRGGPSVHDDTLLLTNERMFKDGARLVQTPLKVVIADSNSIPEDPELRASYDRLHQRVFLDELDDAELFVQMLLQDPFDVEAVMSVADMDAAEAEAKKVRMTQEAAEAIWDVRTELRDVHNISPSPRHYRQAVDILRAQAWMEGRDEVAVEDLEALSTVLPDKPEQQRAVDSVLIARCNPLHDEVLQLINGTMQNGVLVGGWSQLAEAVESAAALPNDTVDNRVFRNAQVEELTPKLNEAVQELKAVLAKPMSGKSRASAMRGKKLLIGAYFRAFEEIHNYDREDVQAKLVRMGVEL